MGPKVSGTWGICDGETSAAGGTVMGLGGAAVAGIVRVTGVVVGALYFSIAGSTSGMPCKWRKPPKIRGHDSVEG